MRGHNNDGIGANQRQKKIVFKVSKGQNEARNWHQIEPKHNCLKSQEANIQPKWLAKATIGHINARNLALNRNKVQEP